MFYFQQLLNQGLSGIDSTNLMSGITAIAYAILLVGFLVSMYQAVLAGGDVRALGVAALKYLIVGIVIANWANVFREVNDSANGVAQLISNSTNSGDMFTNWLTQLKSRYEADGKASITDLVTEATASIISVLLIFVAYVIYPCSVVIFSLFYTLYGVILYVVGPLVLAFLPMTGLGQLAKHFSVNVLIWNLWGILYAIFGALMSAINANQINSIMEQHGFLGFFQGVGNSTLLGFVSIFYALALACIPFIAKRIISGEVGDTMLSLVRAGAMAAGTVLSLGVGYASTSAGGGQTAGGGSASGAGASGASGGSASSAASSSTPPQEPSLDRTIRSAVASATSSDQSPEVQKLAAQWGVAQSDASHHSDSGGDGGSKTSKGGGPNHQLARNGSDYRPHGVAQFLAYHAGRAAGTAVHGVTKKSDGENSEKTKS